VAAGGLLSALLVRNQLESGVAGCPTHEMDRQHHCAIDGPPIEPAHVTSR
jgi:hypothetical protein